MTDVRVDAPEVEEGRDDYASRRLGVAGLASDAVVYGGTRALLKSLSFLLVPLYAHFVAPAEFGRLELVLATVAIVDVLITAGMDGVFARFYFDRDARLWRRQIISLYLVIESVYPAFVVFPLVLLSAQLSDGIFGTAEYAGFFVIALVDVYLTNIVDLPMTLTRLRRRRRRFVAYSLTRGLTQIVLTVLLVAVWHLNVEGILIASLASVGVAFVVTLREYVPDLTRRIDWRVGRQMVSFAWPGIIGGLAFYALGLLDRFFVKHYHGLADAGLYGVAFRYSQVVLVAVLAFRMGWGPWHYPWLRSGRHPQMVARGTLYYFLATGFLAVLVSAWMLPVFHLLMPERYWGAVPAIAPLALAAVATGAYTIFQWASTSGSACGSSRRSRSALRGSASACTSSSFPRSRSSAQPGRRQRHSRASRCSSSRCRTASTRCPGIGAGWVSPSASRSREPCSHSGSTRGSRFPSRSRCAWPSPPPTRCCSTRSASSRLATSPPHARASASAGRRAEDPGER